jgi:hypothetical protein
MKKMFSLMVGGTDGERMKAINVKCESKVRKLLLNEKLLQDPTRDDKIKKFRLMYKYLLLVD